MADTSHEGDIVLTGDDVLVIEDTTYTQTGNIFVRDNATLTLQNAEFIVNVSYHEEFGFEVSENGRLEVINSTIHTSIPGEVVGIYVIDEATIIVQDSSLAEGGVSFNFGYRSSYEIVQLFRGNATISNTNFHALSFVLSPSAGGIISVSNSEGNSFGLNFRDNYHGDFSDLRPGLFEDWTYNDDNINITFKNTSFNSVSAASDGPSQVVFRSSEIFQFAPYAALPTISMKAIDSIIHQVPLGLWRVSAELWGLKTGMHSYWKLSDHATGDSLPELVLENTEIKTGWLVSGRASNLSIDDSIIERLGPYGADNNFTVTNSVVNLLMLYNATNSVLNFDNTTIKVFDAYVPPNYVVIEGNISFTQDAEIKNWYSPSIARRIYPVLLTDINGNTISGASLSLYSKDDVLLWSGQADNQGKASFEIEFNDDNYSDSWRLVIEYDGNSINKEIKFLSSTPIGLNDPPTADAGPDQTVDEGVAVTLDGSNSTDPDDGIASYQWTQIGGISVAFSDPTTSQPTFTAPDVGPNGEALAFQLTVTDYGGLQTSDEVIVSINDSGDGGGDSDSGGAGGGACFITTLF